MRAPRGVTLVEGLVSTVILLTGLVGVFQGLLFASQQNSIANRQVRAGVIAQELMAVLSGQGRGRLVAAGGLFTSPQCTTTIPAPLVKFRGDLQPLPPGLAGFTACYVDFDSLAPSFRAITPAYAARDAATYKRLIAVYRDPANPELLYVGVNVGWTDTGVARVVERFSALYDNATNQTNLEY